MDEERRSGSGAVDFALCSGSWKAGAVLESPRGAHFGSLSARAARSAAGDDHRLERPAGRAAGNGDEESRKNESSVFAIPSCPDNKSVRVCVLLATMRRNVEIEVDPDGSEAISMVFPRAPLRGGRPFFYRMA